MFDARIQPYIKRIPTSINRMDEIQSYDSDNLYPQRAEEINNRSYTLKAATSKLSEFITGRGFEDPFLSNLVVDSDSNTSMNRFLKQLSDDYSIFQGFAFHISYNLNRKVHSLTYIPFKYCRLGLPDEETGRAKDIKVSDNWERDTRKSTKSQIEIESFPIFNMDNLSDEIDEVGYVDHPGHIAYFSENDGFYPYASFDSVFDNAQTQADIGIYELGNIQDGFLPTTVFKYPGRFKNKAEEKAIQDKIEEHKGPGGKRIFVAESPDKIGDNLFESVTMPNVDKMFEFTSKNVKNAIRENYAMPAPLLGVLPETGMFNQQDITEAYKYFNNVTRGRRDTISQFLAGVMKNWKQELPDNFKILELEYI